MAKLTHRERSLASKLGQERREHRETRERERGYYRRLSGATRRVQRVSPFHWLKGTQNINAPDLVARIETAQLLGLTAEIEAKSGELHLFYVKREDA